MFLVVERFSFYFMEGHHMRFKILSASSRFCQIACGYALVLAAFATPVFATPAPAPEIDPGSIGNAMALLAGGFLLLKDWRSKR